MTPDDAFEPDRTDQRWFEVDGRRWRRSDPAIPEALRLELVAELVDARRAVGRALRTGSDADLAAARTRVGDAKVALGERGRPWWRAPTATSVERRAEATARALLAHRGTGSSICPSDVARVVGGERWRATLDQVRTVLRRMAGEGQVVVTRQGDHLDPSTGWTGPVRVALAS